MQKIPGISVIELGVASGHNLWIDQTTLAQVLKCAQEHPNGVKATLNHSLDVRDSIGVLTNFRMDGTKVLADLELLDSNEANLNSKIVELARVMPNEVGFSVDFDRETEEIQGIPYARCSKLNAVSFVDQPAATSGMFTAKIGDEICRFSSKLVDSTEKGMAEKCSIKDPVKDGKGTSEEKLKSPSGEREIAPPVPNASADHDAIVADVLAKLKEGGHISGGGSGGDSRYAQGTI